MAAKGTKPRGEYQAARLSLRPHPADKETALQSGAAFKQLTAASAFTHDSV